MAKTMVAPPTKNSSRRKRASPNNSLDNLLSCAALINSIISMHTTQTEPKNEKKYAMVCIGLGISLRNKMNGESGFHMTTTHKIPTTEPSKAPARTLASFGRVIFFSFHALDFEFSNSHHFLARQKK